MVLLCFSFLFCTFDLLFMHPALAAWQEISGYRNIHQPFYNGTGKLRLAIRRFDVAGTPHVLLVNPWTFETAVMPVASLTTAETPAAQATLSASPFEQAVTRYSSPPYRLQNHGAVRTAHPVDGMFLTVDMCPSKKPFERGLFTKLVELSRSTRKPTPLALAMTGSWLKNHRDDLAWIVRQIKEGGLEVTWVNHSYTHPYEPGTPLERNFLLSPGIDFEREVLATEQIMLENGLVPSPFFRFPGLVADGRLLEKLGRLTLIPVGSDAWLAKGEQPTNGSFILVHGNGNEPPGIARVMPLLQDKRLRLLPLREAFASPRQETDKE